MTRVLLGMSLVLAVGCVEDLGEGRTAAVVQEPAPTAAPAPATDGTVLTVDRARSKIGALGAKITATHPIDFGEFSGEVRVSGSDVSALSFTVQVASLVSDNDRLTGHLKQEDFLFVDQYPTATFTSTGITAGAATEGMTHTVTGDLTVRGVTKRVSFPAKITSGAGEVTAQTEFTINRQDFAITYPGKKDDLVQDTVVLTVAFVAPRTEA